MTQANNLNSWKLPKPLSNTFSRDLKEHYTEEELRQNILEDCPVPKNIPQVPHVDNIMETYLSETKHGYAATNDKCLARIASKIRDIAGPLSQVWKMAHLKKTGNIRTTAVRSKLDQTMTLLAQAFSAVTCCHSLKSEEFAEIELAKAKAVHLLKSIDSTKEFTIVTNDGKSYARCLTCGPLSKDIALLPKGTDFKTSIRNHLESKTHQSAKKQGTIPRCFYGKNPQEKARCTQK